MSCKRRICTLLLPFKPGDPILCTLRMALTFKPEKTLREVLTRPAAWKPWTHTLHYLPGKGWDSQVFWTPATVPQILFTGILLSVTELHFAPRFLCRLESVLLPASPFFMPSIRA